MIPKGKRQVATVAVFPLCGKADADADASGRGWRAGPGPRAAVPRQIPHTPPAGPARVAQRPLLVAVPAGRPFFLATPKKKKKNSRLERSRGAR